MKEFFILLNLYFFYSCSDTKPEPINYGREDCSECKMTIVDESFGAEIISTRGKVYKFDDLACMILFLKKGSVAEKDIRDKLVIDYLNKNTFIEVTKAFYYVGEDVHSPMNGNAAAFSDKQDALTFKRNKPGLIMDWSGVYNKIK